MNKKNIMLFVAVFVTITLSFAEYYTYNPETGHMDPHSSLGPSGSEVGSGGYGPQIDSKEVEECQTEAEELEDLINDLLDDSPETDNEEPDDEKSLLEDEYVENALEDSSDSSVEGNDSNSEPPVTEGDPVFIVTGQYSIKENDVSFIWGINTFCIERNYLSFNYPEGSFGKNWNCSLDARLVFGIPSENKLNEIHNIKERIQQCRTKSASFISYVPSLSEKLKALEQKCELINKEFIINGVSNEKSLYGKAEDYYPQLKYNQIIHISGNGGVETFTYDSLENCFIPENVSIKKRIKITYDQQKKIFTISNINGNKKTFSTEGLPLSESDRYGLKIEYIYDDNSFIKGIVHNDKELITISRNENGKITSIKNNLTEKTIHYSYSADMLKKVIDSQGDSYSYEYDEENDLKELIKPDESKSKVYYSFFNVNGKSKKRVVSHVDEEGFAETYSYDDVEKTVTYNDADGLKSVYKIENSNIIQQQTDGNPSIFWQYNSEGQIISKTDYFGRTDYEYDELGRIKASIKDGNLKKWEYSNEYGFCTQYNNEENTEYRYDYDDKGNCILKSIGGYPVNSYEYESWGGIKKKDGSDGTNNYEYNTNYQVISDKYFSYEYNTHGEMIAKRDRLNNKYSYVYDESGKKLTVTDPCALETSYILNNRKDIERIISYDTKNKIYEITKFVYDRRHLIKEIYSCKSISEAPDEKSFTLLKSCKYTPAGRISKIVLWNYGKARQNDGTGICTEYVYDQKESSVTTKKYFVDENCNRTSNEISSKTQCVYEDEIKKINVSTSDSSILYEYIQNGLLSKIKMPDGKTEEYSYDKAGKIIEIKNIFGGTKSISYGGNGNINKIINDNTIEENFDYFEYGLLKEYSSNNGNRMKFNYEDDGITKQNTINKNLGTERKIYDSLGNLIEYIVKDKDGKLLLDNTVTFSNNYRNASVVSNGVEYENKYDGFGRCIYSAKENAEYEYDTRNNIVLIKKTSGSNVTTTDIQYNALNDISYVKMPSGNQINYYYDAEGNLLKKTDSEGVVWEGTYYSNGKLKTEKGRLLPLKEYFYDEAGNLTGINEAGDLLCRISYVNNENKVIITDAEGNSYTEYYDQSGRIKEINDRMNNRKKIDYFTTNRKITDYNGNKINATDEHYNGIYKINYDSRDYDEIKFNILNQITSIANRNSKEIYEYENNRLKKQIVEGKEYVYTYDSKGRKRTIRGPDINQYFTYNDDDTVKQSVCNDLSVSYVYDSNGNEISSYSTDGNVINKEYDAVGRITSIVQKNKQGNYLFDEYYFYDEDGRIACVSDHEGNVSLFEYDKHGRLVKSIIPYDKEIETKFKEEYSDSGDEPLRNVIYKTLIIPEEYLIKLKKIWSKNRIRLPKAQNGQVIWTECYEYDSRGNRVRKETPAGTINYYYDKENRLVKYGDKNFVNVSYDKNGNMILKESFYKTTKLTYSLNNRITNIVNLNKKDNVSESFIYTYDALSRRITKSKNGRQTMRTVYDGFSMNPLTEYRISGKSQNNIPREYKASTETYFPEQRSFLYVNNMLRGQTSPSDAYVFCNDLRGSIRSVNSVKKAKTDFIDYDANGNPSIISNSKSAVAQKEADSFGLDRLYCGKEYDSSNNLYDYGYRYYSPFNSTFSSADPVLDGFNWYSYCANDPVNFLDPDGLTLLQVYYNFKMQNELWGDKLVGRATEKEIKFIETINTNGEKEKKEIVLNDLKSIGCAITVMSNLISSSIDKDVTPNDINNMKEVFSENKGEESDLDMKKLGDEYGLKFDYWTAEKTNLANKLLEIKGSNEPLYVVANVKYTLEGNTHWVSVQDTVEMDGKFYLNIKGSSINDKKSSRKRDGWIEKDGKVLIEIDEVVKLYTFDATDAKDREEVLCSK